MMKSTQSPLRLNELLGGGLKEISRFTMFFNVALGLNATFDVAGWKFEHQRGELCTSVQ
jgi:hypothetical protein